MLESDDLRHVDSHGNDSHRISHGSDTRYPAVRERLCRESGRVVDRLRSMSLVRLQAELGDSRTRAQAALDCAQELADICADLVGSQRRTVPLLPAHAVGDAVAVMVNDLLAELDRRVWDGDGQQAGAAAEAALVALRQLL